MLYLSQLSGGLKAPNDLLSPQDWKLHDLFLSKLGTRCIGFVTLTNDKLNDTVSFSLLLKLI